MYMYVTSIMLAWILHYRVVVSWYALPLGIDVLRIITFKTAHAIASAAACVLNAAIAACVLNAAIAACVLNAAIAACVLNAAIAACVLNAAIAACGLNAAIAACGPLVNLDVANNPRVMDPTPIVIVVICIS